MRSVGIIGGGPAGLAAARALHDAGIGLALFDDGAPLAQRRHDCAVELGTGIGGAGLFSDGKFSFFPSGTKLYALDNPTRLRRSYAAIATLLHAAGIAAPPFPELRPGDAALGFHTKDYPSSYGTLDQRLALIADLGAGYETCITCFATIDRINRADTGYAIGYRNAAGKRVTRRFSDLIVASGRFGGLALDAIANPSLPHTEQRYEVGIRIEHPDSIGFLRHSKTPDVKFILHDSGVEVRTFCTCRQGEVWMIPYEPMAALSGRSDGPPSRYCNFGLLPRFTGERTVTGRAIWAHFRNRFPEPGTAIWQPLPEFLDGAADGATTLADRPWHPRERFARGDIAGALHPALTAVLRNGLREIIARYPDMNSPECVCLFPAIEGVGRFPETDAGLRIPGENIWCCGDLVGQFRGLIPAMVSGHYAGAAVAETIAEECVATRPVRVRVGA